MSLVDYASSSGEEDEDKVDVVHVQPQVMMREGEEEEGKQDADNNGSGPPVPQNQNGEAPTNIQPASVPSPSVPTIALPDASLLFASPSFSSQQVTGTNHSSRVAAAMSQSASRKRDSNGSAVQFMQNKNPRVSIPRSRNAPDRPSVLLPPQLLGRSNVVTEDIGKLFVNRRGEQ